VINNRFDNIKAQGNKLNELERNQQNISNFVFTPIGFLDALPDFGTKIWDFIGQRVNVAENLIINDIYTRFLEYFKFDLKDGSINVILNSTDTSSILVDMTDATGEKVII
jgi:phage baseplate assembly protein W